MNARAVEHAESELRELRSEARWDWLLAAIALGLAVAATRVRPDLALPLLLAGIAVGARGARAFWQRWDLVDRLLPERDAYLIGEIRAQAQQLATMPSRRDLAVSVRRLLEEPEWARPACVTTLSGELTALASELDDEELVLDPACAVACKSLLTAGEGSPLFDPESPVEDVWSRIRRIRNGFEPLRGAV
jgi:hypothetical protein